MNIKGLLIGCAIAAGMLSIARAEDAVVETDPLTMERVNVCDMYGTGFMQVPGTNTCVKVGGQVRYEQHFSSGGRSRSGGNMRLEFESRSD